MKPNDPLPCISNVAFCEKHGIELKKPGSKQRNVGRERLRQKLILSCQIVLYVERVMNTSLAIPEE